MNVNKVEPPSGLCPVGADSQQAKAPTNGAAAAPKPTPKRRTKGSRAAGNRAKRIIAGLGPNVPPHKAELARVTGRLIILVENASDDPSKSPLALEICDDARPA